MRSSLSLLPVVLAFLIGGGCQRETPRLIEIVVASEKRNGQLEEVVCYVSPADLVETGASPERIRQCVREFLDDFGQAVASVAAEMVFDMFSSDGNGGKSQPKPDSSKEFFEKYKDLKPLLARGIFTECRVVSGNQVTVVSRGVLQIPRSDSKR